MDNQDEFLRKEGGLTADQLFEEVQRDGKICWIDGKAPRELLGLPEGWPGN